jgi:hypothetical protein
MLLGRLNLRNQFGKTLFCNFPFGGRILYKVSTSFIMQRFLVKAFGVVLWSAALATAQSAWPALTRVSDSESTLPLFSVESTTGSPANGIPEGGVSLPSSVVLPRMGPELALQVYRNRASLQAEQLSSYSANTVIRAQLPDTQQYGEYELQRQYSAPRKLAFRAVRFTGDNFVKSNVILRLLQSEASHVEKDEPSLNAITPTNYKFSYKGVGQLNGRVVHIYQLKPRQKRSGLFKGRIYIDAYTASIVRAEGRAVKSPSLFVKKIDFVQDYADIDLFTLPVHIHSEAQARIVGRAVLDIYYSDYHILSGAIQAESVPAL